jgi:LytTr DNA-binding domain
MNNYRGRNALIAKLIIIPIAATVAGHYVFYRQFPWQLNYAFPWFYVLRVATVMTIGWWVNELLYKRLDAILPFHRQPTQRILRQFTEGGIVTLLVFSLVFSVFTIVFGSKELLNLAAFTSGLVVCITLTTLLNASFIALYLLDTIGFEQAKTADIDRKMRENQTKNVPKPTTNATILIESGSSQWQLQPHEIAYFHSSGGIVWLVKADGQRLTTNYRSFADIENRLDDTQFFQLNRQFIVQLAAIRSVEDDTNRKLLIHLQPIFAKNQATETVSVSRYRHAEFKKRFSSLESVQVSA